MRPLLKFLHQLGVIGFMGVLAAQLAVAATTGALQGDALLAVRQAVAEAAGWVLVPALLLATVTGLLLMAVHAPFMEARWVWVKALLGAVVGALVVWGTQAAVKQALAGAAAAPGSPEAAVLAQALRTEWLAGWVVLGLSVLAVALGVWRPRLAQRVD